jgi:hypothetical protein
MDLTAVFEWFASESQHAADTDPNDISKREMWLTLQTLWTAAARESREQATLSETEDEISGGKVGRHYSSKLEAARSSRASPTAWTQYPPAPSCRHGGRRLRRPHTQGAR